MSELTFRVYGVPRPGGSKRAFYIKKIGRAVLVDASKHIKTWRGEVKDAALSVVPERPLDCPLELEVEFLMPRPKYHYRTGKHAGELKENAPKWHTVNPDITKLMRGTEDSLSKILWKDDNLIYRQFAVKKYDERPGAVITVRWKE